MRLHKTLGNESKECLCRALRIDETKKIHRRLLLAKTAKSHLPVKLAETYTQIVDEFFSARVPSSSAEVRGIVIHDIKEIEGVKQQKEQEDKRDEEEGDEVNGEVEEITRRAHET